MWRGIRTFLVVVALTLVAAAAVNRPAQATTATHIDFTEFSWTNATVDPVHCSVMGTDAHCVFNQLTIIANSGAGDSDFLMVEVDYSFADNGSPDPNLADPLMLELSLNGMDLAGYDEFHVTTEFFLVGYDRDLVGTYTGRISSAYVCTSNPGCELTADITGTTSGSFRVVPEPATLTIFAFGLAGLGFMTRRRRREAVAA